MNLDLIKRVIKRNEQRWNKRGDIDPDNESWMLYEEFQETHSWLDWIRIHWKLTWWNHEVVDGCLDLIFVAIWTMHKLWLTAEEIYLSFNHVCAKNDAKWTKKDESWKIIKPKEFRPPFFDKIVKSIPMLSDPLDEKS